MMTEKGKAHLNEYRTGGTAHHSGSAPLLAVGIFLFLTVLGMLLTAGFLFLRATPLGNHKVIASLETAQNLQNTGDNLHMRGTVMNCQQLGITCQSISPFCERYYQLPPGVYVIHVEQYAPAAQRGILPGDVIISANGRPIFAPDMLLEIFHTNPPGNLISIDVNRKGKVFTVYFAAGE